MYLFSIFVFILGTIIGSFLNVVILRYNTGSSIQGRSGCMSCGKTLEWYELIPVLSYIFLLGRCGRCKSRISVQYPIVELLTGIIFLLTFLKFSFIFTYYLLPITFYLHLLLITYYLLLFSILIVILVYDLRHKIIPNGFVYAFIALSFLQMFFSFRNGFSFVMPTLGDFLAGPILFIAFFLLWFLSRGRWMGFGDAKLVLGIGWLLGLLYGVSAVVFGFWIGAIVGIGLLLVKKLSKLPVLHRIALFLGANALTMKSEIPFAPFLILGLWIAFFFGIDIVSFSRFLAF